MASKTQNGSTLKPAQAKKVDELVATLTSQLKLKADADKTNLRRFVDKYARFKLGVRGTGPHSHGFNKEQRQAIMSATREKFGIKATERKPAAKKATPAKRQRSNRKPSTAQLARQQTERAQEQES